MIDFNKLQSAEVDKTFYPFFSLDNCLLDNPSCVALAKDFPDIKSGGSIPPSSINLEESIKKLISDLESEEMKAILEVEKMTTTAPYQADVLPTVMVAPGLPTAGSPAAQATVSPGPLQGGKAGVLVPKVNFSKTGGQGGALQTKGYSYIGNNPVGETNEKKTKVKLLKEDLVDL